MKLEPTKIKILGARVLIRLDPRVKKTPGGILLPEQVTKIERVMEGSGRVVRVGSATSDSRGPIHPVDLKPGDRVMFRGFLKDAAPLSTWGYDGDDYCIIHKRDILAKIPDVMDIGMAGRRNFAREGSHENSV